METISVKQPINLKVVKFELDFTPFYQDKPAPRRKSYEIKIPKVKHRRRRSFVPSPPLLRNASIEKRDAKDLVEELLDELYADQRDWSRNSTSNYCRGSTTAPSLASTHSHCREDTDAIERNYLETLDVEDLQKQCREWESKLQETGQKLAKYVRVRDRLRRQQKRLCAAFTVLLRHITGDNDARFGLTPGTGEGPGEGGFSEWLHAMRLVARLPAGVPQHFRRKLWLTLADRHLVSKNIDWPLAERACFRGTAQPDDTELGAQIIKDLHRTGCSLFCGAEGRENQAMLRRVLLAYARWNKDVGYCQGFNMLAAIILEVMEKSESDSLKVILRKYLAILIQFYRTLRDVTNLILIYTFLHIFIEVMIYLVEAVLPEGYFADDLRGLSADMAAFRDLLRLRLPRLANHMDYLQRISDGGGVEPPLPDVFTMQWFLTLYATWLPRASLLRVWDLVLLDGNHVLLLTALAIWDMLQDRILSARSADEFYSCMGGGAGLVWAAGEALVARVVALGAAPELPRLRSLHRYRVTPPAPHPPHPPTGHSTMQSMTKKGLRLFYSEDEGDSSDDGNKMALATVIPKRDELMGAGDRLSLDIGALKRQYARLRERQRQAHVILAAACARHAAVGVSTSPTSLTVNNLLLGKSAIVSSRGRRLGPPPGAIPPTRQTVTNRDKIEDINNKRRNSEDTISWNEEKNKKTLSRRDSLKWKDVKKEKIQDRGRKPSIDMDEAGDGVIVSEHEANEMIASLRSRSSSSSSYSSHSASSTDTSLCDDKARASDSEGELPFDGDKGNKLQKTEVNNFKTPIKEYKLNVKESKITHSVETNDNLINFDREVPDITEYLDSAAGEPLRTYIDGFQTKLKNNVILKSNTDLSGAQSPFSNISSSVCKTDLDKNEVLQRLNRLDYDITSKSIELIRPKTRTTTTTNFTDLSPLDISPCNFEVTHKSPFHAKLISNIGTPTDFTDRPPDIIDSFTKYPNFVPDIDLSEKNASNFESLTKSPGEESLVISEDEPPIPLKIDKYFEHSPEFFGARVTDPNSLEIPNRRAPKRLSRLPKKPDSLTLQTNNNERIQSEEAERASSLPQNLRFQLPKISSSDEQKEIYEEKIIDPNNRILLKTPLHIQQQANGATPEKNPIIKAIISPKSSFLEYGRKNSERALQIIQENSKILNRILTKQNMSEKNIIRKTSPDLKDLDHYKDITANVSVPDKPRNVEETRLIDSPFLKESTSDTLIGVRKRYVTDENDKSSFVRIRPISIDDPFSLEVRSAGSRNKDLSLLNLKSPSSESLGNKTDLYGWINKGFLAKCNYETTKPSYSSNEPEDTMKCSDITGDLDFIHKELKLRPTSEWRHSYSEESRSSVSLPSTGAVNAPLDHYVSSEYKYSFPGHCDDYVSNKASEVSSNTTSKGQIIREKLCKTDSIEHSSEFTNVVTSSVSFTYEHSADNSPIGAKSNSSDTLCQIASLDQVSTPMSPKVFSIKETPTLLIKDMIENTETSINKTDTDETCSTITSLIDTDTLSSLSYPRSPSTGSYHHFPTRPSMRMPKELTVRLGMYPKDSLSSPHK